MDPVYWGVVGVIRTLFRVQGLRFTLTGTEYVPRRGGAVMALNHTGYLDYMYAGLAAQPHRRLVRFMAKDAVFRHKVSGPLMRGMKHIPVDRSSGAAAYQLAVEALRAGEIVGVYPERTISRSFELKDFKTGAVRMAQDADVPILPTIVWGAQRVWTKDHPKRIGRTKIPIHVAIAPPMTVSPGEDPGVATARLKQVMSELLERVWSVYPPVSEAEQVFVPKRLGGRAPSIEEAVEIRRAELERRGQPPEWA
ncbi:MAG: 1-acyl-sn-glycerol-3-phosphate acyltransferase [Actinomycetales bacterium]|nr:MAG: 1-acyl-sn-glycerol-3-phosphate acyltransferase [Actinomycetales bacterium]